MPKKKVVRTRRREKKHVTVGQADPVQLTFKRSGPEPICEWNQAYLPLLPLPWCAAPPVRP